MLSFSFDKLYCKVAGLKKIFSFCLDLGICSATVYSLLSLWATVVMTNSTKINGDLLYHCAIPVDPGAESIKQYYKEILKGVIAWNMYDLRLDCPSGSYESRQVGHIPSACPKPDYDVYGGGYYWYPSVPEYELYAVSCDSYPMPKECDALILEHTIGDLFGSKKVSCRYRNEQLRGAWQYCGNIQIRLTEWGKAEALICNMLSDADHVMQTGYFDCKSSKAVFPLPVLWSPDGGGDEISPAPASDDVSSSPTGDSYFSDYYSNDDGGYDSNSYGEYQGRNVQSKSCNTDPRDCVGYLNEEAEYLARKWDESAPGSQEVAESFLLRFFSEFESRRREELTCDGGCTPSSPAGKHMSWELFQVLWFYVILHVLCVGELVGNVGMSRTHCPEPFASVSVLVSLRRTFKLLAAPMTYPELCKGFEDGYIKFDYRGRTMRWCALILQLWNIPVSLSFLVPYAAKFTYHGHVSLSIWSITDAWSLGLGLNVIRSFVVVLYTIYSTARKYHKARRTLYDAQEITTAIPGMCPYAIISCAIAISLFLPMLSAHIINTQHIYHIYADQYQPSHQQCMTS